MLLILITFLHMIPLYIWILHNIQCVYKKRKSNKMKDFRYISMWSYILFIQHAVSSLKKYPSVNHQQTSITILLFRAGTAENLKKSPFWWTCRKIRFRWVWMMCEERCLVKDVLWSLTFWTSFYYTYI